MAKYKVFISDDINVLENEEFIGDANTYQEACKILSTSIKEKNFYSDSYWRILMGSTATFIDFGSWSKFGAIVPPVPNSVIIGEEEEI